ncbi:hypothetical protein ACFL2D_02980 [Patescibacteria group bacterium]
MSSEVHASLDRIENHMSEIERLMQIKREVQQLEKEMREAEADDNQGEISRVLDRLHELYDEVEAMKGPTLH